MDTFIEILLGVFFVVSFAINFCLIVKKKIESGVIDAINYAEESGKKAQEKMIEAVDYVYVNLPPIVRTFVSKEAIERTIQKYFNKIEEYVKKQEQNKKQ